MDITVKPDLEDATGDLLILPVYQGRNWGPGAAAVVAGLGGWVEAYLDGVDFNGKIGQTAFVPGTGGFGNVLFAGLGEEADADVLRKVAGIAGRAAQRYESVATTLSALEIDGAVEAVVYGFLLGQYKFVKYLSDPSPSRTATLLLVGSDPGGESPTQPRSPPG